MNKKAKTGRDQAMMILSRLDEAEEKIEKGSVLGSALKGAHKLLKKRSLVFVISDFRSSLLLLEINVTLFCTTGSFL